MCCVGVPAATPIFTVYLLLIVIFLLCRSKGVTMKLTLILWTLTGAFAYVPGEKVSKAK